jgi:hypothetical protein
VTSSGSIEPPGPDVLLRTVVPPYRLGEVLLRIGELKLTGRLSLSSDIGRRTILLHSGFPVFTQSSLFAERLGAIGVRHGFFGRQDVARALAHARDRRSGLGESLLELGYVDPGRLHALLGVQLREVVAASCSGGPQRARFHSGGAALRDVIILKLHPLTSVLAAIAGLPAIEQSKLLHAVADRKLSATPIPAFARPWLGDLGFMGDNELLLQGDPTVGAARSRLLARYRTEAEKSFDAAQVGFAFAGARVLTDAITPGRVADLVTLTLLMSGALELADGGAARAGRGDLLANTAESLLAALDEVVERPLAETRATATSEHEQAVDRAIEAYLSAKRERGVAAAAAVWGPSVEARDTSVPPDLLRLYLTLKPEKRPEVVLGVSEGASPEQVMQAYARRAELVASVDQTGASEHLRCRAAELSQRFDDALDALLPGTSGRASLPPPPAVPALAPGAHEDSSGEHAASERSAAREAQDASATSARGDTRASRRSEAVAAKVDALMRASQWRAVLDTLESQPAGTKLPFTLQLARAMAQRELQSRRGPGQSWSWLVALLVGLAIGYILRHFGVLPPAAFELPRF